MGSTTCSQGGIAHEMGTSQECRAGSPCAQATPGRRACEIVARSDFLALIPLDPFHSEGNVDQSDRASGCASADGDEEEARVDDQKDLLIESVRASSTREEHREVSALGEVESTTRIPCSHEAGVIQVITARISGLQ